MKLPGSLPGPCGSARTLYQSFNWFVRLHTSFANQGTSREPRCGVVCGSARAQPASNGFVCSAGGSTCATIVYPHIALRWAPHIHSHVQYRAS